MTALGTIKIEFPPIRDNVGKMGWTLISIFCTKIWLKILFLLLANMFFQTATVPKDWGKAYIVLIP